ncbi:HAD family hydrolase [Streptomyces sp. NPDC049813]|uniref:HAD family hydrolase n=1 Tax=Streptomyces sp. NPDC049813 TaxID=3365597 RepID=UPI0037B63D6F
MAVAAAGSLPAVRYAAFDLDGTLLDPRGRLRPGLADRLAELAASGLAPLVVSGRAVRSFRELALAGLPSSVLADEVLLGDGAVVLRRSTGRVTALRWLPADVLRTLADGGARDFVAEAGGELVASSRRAALLYARMYALSRSVVTVDSHPSPARGQLTAVTAFDASEDLARRCGARHDTDRVGPLGALQIRPRGTCKASGLAAHLARRAERPVLDAVTAFGDAFNDACLLAACRLGVAVQGADEVCARCAHVSLDRPLADFLSGFGPERAARLSRAAVPPGTARRGRGGATPCSGAHRRPGPKSALPPSQDGRPDRR